VIREMYIFLYVINFILEGNVILVRGWVNNILVEAFMNEVFLVEKIGE